MGAGIGRGGRLNTPMGPCRRCFKEKLLFISFTVIRTLVIYLNSLCFLNVRYCRPIGFVFTKYFTTIICTVLVCSLTCAFNSVNGTTIIILLIVRVNNSNNAFPVSIAPGFFRTVGPCLPCAFIVGTVHRYIYNACNNSC